MRNGGYVRFAAAGSVVSDSCMPCRSGQGLCEFHEGGFSEHLGLEPEWC